MRNTPRSLRAGQPIWLKRSSLKQRYAALDGRRGAEIAIVGGGITGALVAHAFATAGVSTVLLEKALVGSGSTAASSALLLQEPELSLVELERRYGVRTSRRIWRLSHEGVSDLLRLLRRLRIPCGLRTCDAVYYATRAEAVEQLHQEFILRRNAGFEAEWLSPGALRRWTAIPGRGGIRTSGSAQLDPYHACVGVMRAAAASGALNCEQSRVRRIQSRRDSVRIVTTRGTVHARRVVIATGYATTQFRPLVGRFRMYRT